MLNIVILLLIIYIYNFKFNHPDFKIVTYDDIKFRVKSGDMILFASLDSINQLFIASYFTHVGIVYRKDKDSLPVIVESYNTHREKLTSDQYTTDIAVCDLQTRFNSYRGYIFYKELAEPITQNANNDFVKFIKYARDNIKYDYNYLSNEIGKLLLNTA